MIIDINLIPGTSGKGGPKDALSAINIPKEILLGVGLGVVTLMLLVHVALGIVWLVKFGELSVRQAAWQKLLPDKKILDNINAESTEDKNRINVLMGLTVKKSLPWSPKFNAISDALPRGLWIRRMVYDRNGLSMDGSVVSKSQNEINNVGQFLSGLKQNKDFMGGFASLEVNSIQRGKSNAVEVTDFNVMAKSVEIKGNENRAK